MGGNRKVFAALAVGASLLGFSVVSNLSGAGDAPQVARSERLMTARQGSCAALLSDGAIFITGGSARKTLLSSTEFFNVRRGASPGPSMLTARVDHACAALSSGAVLVAGGTLPNGGALDSAELYEPATGVWSAVGSMSMRRANATASTLPDGRILIGGGEIGGVPTNTLEVFNPATKTFQAIPQALLSLRSQHAAAVLANGKVLIAGGMDRDKPLDTMEVFDPVAGTVSAAGKMSVPRTGLTATLLLDGRVLLAGGSSNGKNEIASAEILDPKTGSTVPAASMGAPRRDHLALRLPENNAVLIIGGAGNGNLLAAAELYIPWRNRYKPLASLKLPMGEGAAAQVSAAVKSVLAETVVHAATSDPSVFPVVSTDKDDYAPGERATITGEGWPANTRITFHLDRQPVPTATGLVSDWTATSNEAGQFTTTYEVVQADLGVTFTLTVDVPGTDETAQILRTVKFTDGNVKVKALPTAIGSAFHYNYALYTGLGCSGTPKSSGSDANSIGAGSGESLMLEALEVQNYSFVNWTGPGTFTSVEGSGGKKICITAFGSGTDEYVANYSTVSATAITIGSATGMYGSTTNLSATLKKADGTLLSGKSIEFKLNGTVVGSATTNASGIATLSGVALSGISAGTSATAITASFAGDSGLGASSATGSLKVDPRPITVTADAKTKPYGDADPALTYQITNGSLVNNDSLIGSLTRVAGENVGTYAINKGSLSGLPNYDVTYVGANLTITKREITVTADEKTKVYGDVDPVFTYKVTSGSVVTGDTFSGALSRAAGNDVGTYAINQGTLALSTNYSLSFGGANLTITPREIRVTADAKEKVYGDADPALTYTITAGSLVTGDNFSGILTREKGENVGTYAIQQGTLGLSANYTLKFIGADLTISKRPITITADAKTKTYGDADPQLTYNVTADSLVNGDTVTGKLTREPGENVGAYAIQQGSITAGTNYNLTFVSAKLTIETRVISITADNKSKVYGDADPELTFKMTSGTLVGSDKLTLTRAAGENVGVYAIQQGTLTNAGNYNLTFTPGTLTISARSITVTADANSKFYGDVDPLLTYSPSVTLAYNDAFSGALTRAPGENVGTYAISQGTLALSTNYTLTFVGANLIIKKRPITVTADPKTKVYGTPDPGLTYQITNGSMVGTDTLIGTLTRSAGQDVKIYAIYKGSLAASSNYDLTFVGATFTITQAETGTTLTSAFGSLSTPSTVVLTATVASPDLGGVAGTVQFVDVNPSDNSIVPLGEVSTLSNAQAKLTVSVGTGTGMIAPGSHLVQAIFSGNGNLYGSQSKITAKSTVTITAPSSGSVYPANTVVSSFAGSYNGPGTPTARWLFDIADGADATVNGSNITGSYNFKAAGVYNVTLAATDGAGSIAVTSNITLSGGVDLPAMVVIYDPAAGFVTGGGWINSPQGACRNLLGGCTETAIGKANFGFVAKYQKGANLPTGETEFQFKAGNLDFKSTSYEWLVVSGSMAQYKGSGTIKGQTGTFKFMLTARDGDNQATKKDGIRMKITDASGQVVYDNMFEKSTDDTNSSGNTQDLEGGSIQIHSK